MFDLQEITTRIIKEVGSETLKRAESMKPDEVDDNGTIEYFEGGFSISYNGDLAGYYEFSTGAFAKSYLADKPTDIKNEAMKFYKNGKGTLQSRPYLYPAILWAIAEIENRIESEVASQWNKLRFK